MLQIKSYQSVKFNDLVERIWILENRGDAVEVISPPDQYVNLVFPLEESTWKHNEHKVILPQIEGVTLQSTITKYPLNSKLIGVRFYPFGLASFFNVKGKDLVDKMIELSTLTNRLPQLKKVESELENLEAIEVFLSQLLIHDNYKRTKLLRDFYKYFRWQHQASSIEEFCEEFGTNYTSLNRLFSKVVGITAKRFERLIKFRKALCDLSDTEESLTSIGMDSGYFDQSHFIREFKLFMNYSPKVYNSLIRKADKDTRIINYNFNLY